MQVWRRRTIARSAVAAALAVQALAGCGSSGSGPSPEAAPSTAPGGSTTTSVLPGAVAPAPVATRSARIGDLAAVGDAAPAAPTRLRVPDIGVDAPVLPVGVEDDGELDVPSADDVGWYRFGPAPGLAGSAVLAAHVDFDGRRGAFFELRRLEPGALVEVVAGGQVRRFRVVEVRRIPKDALPDELFTRSGEPRLALITCGGRFDRATRSYEDNVVATAVPA